MLFLKNALTTMKTKDYPMSAETQKCISERIHGTGKFDYSRLETILSSKDNICLSCLHCSRDITVRWSSHISGTGCRTCKNIEKGYRHRLSDEEIKTRIESKLPGVFDFSNYKREGLDITLTCNKHGPVSLQLYSLLAGHNGCPQCTGGKRSRLGTGIFVEKALVVHNNKYDYSKAEYGKNNKEEILVICSHHGEFSVRPDMHLIKKQGCPKCSYLGPSDIEIELKAFLKSCIQCEILTGARNILPSGKELDIYIPELKLAIEMNGVYFHSTKFRPDPKYHLNKTEEAEALGIKLIHIFSDEWLKKKELVKSRLQAILNKSPRTFARKLKVRILPWSETRFFLENHHTQGAGHGTKFNLGLIDDLNEIKACMTFSNIRYGKTKTGKYELVRYCSDGTVVGGFSKLLNFFIKTYQPNEIISYADRRWSQGNVYEQNGFSLVGKTNPGYFYVGEDWVRYSRQVFQKHKLQKRYTNFDPSLTEEQNCNNNGLYRLYDSGHLIYKMEIKNPGL